MRIQAVFQYAVFYRIKGGILHDKRHPFGMQKDAFYNTLIISLLQRHIKLMIVRYNKHTKLLPLLYVSVPVSMEQFFKVCHLLLQLLAYIRVSNKHPVR